MAIAKRSVAAISIMFVMMFAVLFVNHGNKLLSQNTQNDEVHIYRSETTSCQGCDDMSLRHIEAQLHTLSKLLTKSGAFLGPGQLSSVYGKFKEVETVLRGHGDALHDLFMEEAASDAVDKRDHTLSFTQFNDYLLHAG